MFDPFLSNYRPQNSGVVFGEIAGQKSLADLQDLLNSVRYRMTQMASALGKIDPSRVKDPAKFTALMVDAGNLKNRVAQAESVAASALSYAALNPLLPLSVTPAQGQYDGLMRAMKQGYPPDGARIQRGDFDDVVNRIKQIGGVTVDLSQTPQPRAQDVDRTLLNLTPRLPDIQKPPELDWLEELYRFVKAYEKEILVAGLAIGAWMLWASAPHVLPAAKTAAKTFLLA